MTDPEERAKPDAECPWTYPHVLVGLHRAGEAMAARAQTPDGQGDPAGVLIVFDEAAQVGATDGTADLMHRIIVEGRHAGVHSPWPLKPLKQYATFDEFNAALGDLYSRRPAGGEQ